MKVKAVLVVLTGINIVAAHGDHGHVHKRQAPTTSKPVVHTDSTAIPPLASISAGMPLKPIPTFVNTFAPGATPPIAGAPVLPPQLSLTGWPPVDAIPPTDSPEVKQWLKELDGFHIPNLRPTKGAECSLDPEAAADAANRGWWTCGGHTRSTDVTNCPNKLQWGVSFDDGPAPHTPRLLKKLKDINVRATFFVVGSRLIDRAGMVVDQYMNGHEISVHTWSHSAGLTTMTNEQIVAELGWTRKIIKAAIGVTPTTMRPPRGDIDDRVRAISLAMGLVPILWTATPDGGKFDTFDWRVVNGDFAGDGSFKVFQDILTKASTFNTGIITLQHDLFEATVDLAVGYTLDAAMNHNPKFTLEPIGQCMNIPSTNLYWETNKNASFPLRNHTVDITGDGKADFNSAGVVNTPLLASVSLVALGLFAALL